MAHLPDDVNSGPDTDISTAPVEAIASPSHVVPSLSSALPPLQSTGHFSLDSDASALLQASECDCTQSISTADPDTTIISSDSLITTISSDHNTSLSPVVITPVKPSLMTSLPIEDTSLTNVSSSHNPNHPSFKKPRHSSPEAITSNPSKSHSTSSPSRHHVSTYSQSTKAPAFHSDQTASSSQDPLSASLFGDPDLAHCFSSDTDSQLAPSSHNDPPDSELGDTSSRKRKVSHSSLDNQSELPVSSATAANVSAPLSGSSDSDSDHSDDSTPPSVSDLLPFPKLRSPQCHVTCPSCLKWVQSTWPVASTLMCVECHRALARELDGYSLPLSSPHKVLVAVHAAYFDVPDNIIYLQFCIDHGVKLANYPPQ